MKPDLKHLGVKEDDEEDDGLSFKQIALSCLLFAGLLALVMIWLNF